MRFLWGFCGVFVRFLWGFCEVRRPVGEFKGGVIGMVVGHERPRSGLQKKRSSK